MIVSNEMMPKSEFSIPRAGWRLLLKNKGPLPTLQNALYGG